MKNNKRLIPVALSALLHEFLSFANFVSPVKICSAFEEFRMYVEVIPRKFTDIVSKPFYQIADRSSPKNNAGGYKTLNNAIRDIEDIGLCLLSNVKTENLLFIFGQTVESLRHALIEFPIFPPLFDPFCNFDGYCNDEKCRRKEEYDTQPRAIILCKLINTDSVKKFITTEQQNGSGNAKYYQITWRELQEIKKCLY